MPEPVATEAQVHIGVPFDLGQSPAARRRAAHEGIGDHHLELFRWQIHDPMGAPEHTGNKFGRESRQKPSNFRQYGIPKARAELDSALIPVDSRLITN